jgi:decaprenylphospho-beta-D-ribofuranose 2-oxidase
VSLSSVANDLPVERLERVWGLGRTLSAQSYVYRPSTREGLDQVFALARAHGRTIGLRGAGRSYGDVALSSGGICLDLSRLNRILDWDAAQGAIRVEPGVSLRQLWQHVVEDGWWPAVVPGTMFATVGGCAAANVHGKNNWNAGPFGDHILEFELLLPTGEVRRCSRETHPDLFHAAIGGCGMLGCFLTLTLQLRRVHSGLLAVREWTVGHLDEMIGLFDERRGQVDHLVGWVDCFAPASALGRGIVHAATYLQPGDDPNPQQTLRVAVQDPLNPLLGIVPRSILRYFMRPLLTDAGMRLVNASTFYVGRCRSGRAYRQSHARFAFLLDCIPNWWLAYGAGGLIEYQSFIPRERAAAVFRKQLTLLQQRGLLPYACAFKCHRADPFLLTHGVDGFSLGFHFKVTAATRARLAALSAELDRLVVDAGGRLYFAKDSTTTPQIVRQFLGAPCIERFFELKRRCDPGHILETDLFRRLFPAPDA